MGAATTQGFYAALELLPMYRGVDPDVELFASGLVQDDDGEWEGAASADAAPADVGAAGIAAVQQSRANMLGQNMQVGLLGSPGVNLPSSYEPSIT